MLGWDQVIGISTIPFHAFKCLGKQNTLLAVSPDSELLAGLYGSTVEYLQ